ncbi:hypothetical protein CUTA107171_28405 [Cupriavidus taiwanensis]
MKAPAGSRTHSRRHAQERIAHPVREAILELGGPADPTPPTKP